MYLRCFRCSIQHNLKSDLEARWTPQPTFGHLTLAKNLYQKDRNLFFHSSRKKNTNKYWERTLNFSGTQTSWIVPSVLQETSNLLSNISQSLKTTNRLLNRFIVHLHTLKVSAVVILWARCELGQFIWTLSQVMKNLTSPRNLFLSSNLDATTIIP